MIINKGYLSKLRNSKQDIVFATGCYNLYHPGHVHFLKKAKELGDLLVVAVAHDEITKFKRVPQLNHDQRMYMVNSHRDVDYVILENKHMPPFNVRDIVEALRPTTWATGTDNPNLGLYEPIIKELGIKLGLVPRNNDDIFNISTTELIRRVRTWPDKR